MNLLSVISVIIMVACNNGNPSNENVKPSAVSQKNIDVSNNNQITKTGSLFADTSNLPSVFKKNSKLVKLPFNLEYNSPEWGTDDIFAKEIDRDSAVKYIFNGDKSKVKMKSGGFKQFYNRYYFKIGNCDELIYYTTDNDGFTGYYMVSFVNKKASSKPVLLCGTKGEEDPEAQVESSISTDGSIISKMLKMDVNKEGSKTSNIQGQKKEITYKINADSQITLVKETQFVNTRLKLNTNRGGRLEEY